LRFKFKNGTEGHFETLPVFGHHADIPLTEFIYRAEVTFSSYPITSSPLTSVNLQNAAITSNRQWAQVCGSESVTTQLLENVKSSTAHVACSGAIALVFCLGLFVLSRFVRRSRANARTRVRLEGDEVSYKTRDYGSVSRTWGGEYGRSEYAAAFMFPYSPSLLFPTADEMIT
jgi:hypothetical protein